MGEVYSARDTRLDRTVAIKVLPAQVADNPEVADDRSPVPIATSRAAEQHPRFSPDGRWIVYQSNES